MNKLLIIMFAFLPVVAFGQLKKGWYGYEPVQVESEDNDTVKKPDIPWDKLDIIAPDKFVKYLKEAKDYALTYRTVENYSAYQRIRKIAVQRSEEFASVANLWAQLNPDKTGERDYPTNSYGRKAYVAEKNSVVKDYIIENRGAFGLIYFFSTSCPYCTKQEPILDYFKDRYGWDVEKIDINKSDTLAARFNITKVPSIIIVSRETYEWFLISGGINPLPEIESRVYKTLRFMNGGTDESNYNFNLINIEY